MVTIFWGLPNQKSLLLAKILIIRMQYTLTLGSLMVFSNHTRHITRTRLLMASTRYATIPIINTAMSHLNPPFVRARAKNSYSKADLCFKKNVHSPQYKTAPSRPPNQSFIWLVLSRFVCSYLHDLSAQHFAVLCCVKAVTWLRKWKLRAIFSRARSHSVNWRLVKHI